MIIKRVTSALLVASTVFLMTFPTGNSHPTQSKSANVHSSIDGREITGSAGLLQSGRSLMASHITPIAPELQHDSSAAQVGGVHRIDQGLNNDNGTITEAGDNHQKRHVSVNNHGHRQVSIQNINEDHQSQVVTFHPNQNHHQNSGATIVSLRPEPVSTHHSVFNYNNDNNNLNSNQQAHVFNSNSNTEASHNQQVSISSQNPNNRGFNNAAHQTSVNRGILQSASHDAGFPSNTRVLPATNLSPVYQTSISKGVLQSSTNIAGSQNSVRKGAPQANINEVEQRGHSVNVIQGGSVVQQQNDLHDTNGKTTDHNRANLAQRLSSVLAFNREQNNQNKENDIQDTVGKRPRDDQTDDQTRARQISSHSPSVISHGSVTSSPVLSSGPCVAAFSVRKGLAAATDKTKPRRVTFQDVLSNTGGWSKSRHEFEVPCTGLYYFSFNAISTKNSDFTLGLMKDGRYQVTAYGGKESYQWGGNSALLFLTPGEKVYLELQEGELYEHPYEEAYTTFSGFLINSL